MSCAQWQKAQVFIYFRSRIIEETIIRTNSVEKAITVVNPTIGGAKPPPLRWKFWIEKYPTTFSWTKGYSLRNFVAFARTVFKCITDKQTNKQTNKQTFFFIYIDIYLDVDGEGEGEYEYINKRIQK
jgi:hypothetical protein